MLKGYSWYYLIGAWDASQRNKTKKKKRSINQYFCTSGSPDCTGLKGVGQLFCISFLVADSHTDGDNGPCLLLKLHGLYLLSG